MPGVTREGDRTLVLLAAWVLEVEHFRPSLVECDAEGRSLFAHANAEVNETCQRFYDGLPLPALQRLGGVTSPTQEMLWTAA